MENKSFCDKNAWYYNLVKARISSLVPQGQNTILDLGCGVGALGRNLRELNKVRELVGVEIFKEAADEAAKHYEKVYHGDLERLRLDYENYFDFVVCGDILEHLTDPWRALRRINRWLKDGGHVVVSIPNVRYWRILWSLVFSGYWEYAEAGILDKTHLRFFTKKSFLKALIEAGFNVEYSKFYVVGTKHKFFNTATFRLFEEFIGYQITIVGKKVSTSLKTVHFPSSPEQTGTAFTQFVQAWTGKGRIPPTRKCLNQDLQQPTMER